MTLFIPRNPQETRSASYREEKGELKRLARRIYADAQTDPVEAVRENPLYLAANLYPKFRLVGESAILRGLTPMNELLVSATSKTRSRDIDPITVIRKLQFSDEFEQISVSENGQPVRVRVSPPELAIIEALDGFGSGDPDVLRIGVERLDRIHGNREAAIKAVQEEAERTGKTDLNQKIEQYLAKKELTPMTENFLVLWYNSVIGKLGFDGARYYWEGRDGWVVPFQHNGRSLPPFLANLREEGVLKQIRNRSDIEVLRNGGRFLSNISISPEGGLAGLREPDMITERIENNVRRTASGLFFSGGFDITLQGLVGSLKDGDTCVGEVARMIEEDNLPTISGAQYKAAVFLNKAGELAAAGINGNPFSHILKLAPANDRHFGFNEYVCMKATQAAGVTIADVAMVNLPAFADQKQTGLLVERYDVADSDVHTDRYFQIDCCAQLGLSPDQKGEGTWEAIADMLDKEVSDPDRDKRQLFIRAVTSWLLGDSDAHLKNFSILRLNTDDGFGPNSQAFTKTILAPAYDITSSVNYAPNPHFCLTLNGKHRDLKKSDFRSFGAHCGFNRAESDFTMENAAVRCSQFVQMVAANSDLDPEHRMFIERLQKHMFQRMSELKLGAPKVEQPATDNSPTHQNQEAATSVDNDKDNAVSANAM